MKRLAVVLPCIAVLCLGLNALAADEIVNLSGIWTQDVKHSDAFPKMMGGFGGGGPDASMGGGPMMGGMGGPMGGPPMGAPGNGAPPPKVESTLTIEQNGDELQVSNVLTTNGVAGAPIVEKFVLDGKQRVELVKGFGSDTQNKQTTKAKAKKNKVEVSVKTAYPSFTSEMVREYNLSKDRKKLTLTITTLGTFPTQQKLIYLSKQ